LKSSYEDESKEEDYKNYRQEFEECMEATKTGKNMQAPRSTPRRNPDESPKEIDAAKL